MKSPVQSNGFRVRINWPSLMVWTFTVPSWTRKFRFIYRSNCSDWCQNGKGNLPRCPIQPSPIQWILPHMWPVFRDRKVCWWVEVSYCCLCSFDCGRSHGDRMNGLAKWFQLRTQSSTGRCSKTKRCKCSLSSRSRCTNHNCPKQHT